MALKNQILALERKVGDFWSDFFLFMSEVLFFYTIKKQGYFRIEKRSYYLTILNSIIFRNYEIPYCFNFSLKVERDICRILAALDLFPLNLSRVLIM